MTQPVRVEWLSTVPADGADPALDERRSADLFQTLPWFQHLSRCGIDRGEGLHVASVHEAGGRWLLPLQQRRGAQAAAFGSSLTSLSNYYSSLYGPVGDPQTLSAEGCRALARALRTRGSVSAVLDLQPLDAEASFIGLMESALRAEGYSTDRYFCFGNWYLPVAGRSWDEIERSISSRQRNTVRRARKRLSEAGPYTLTIHQQPGAELEAAIADYVSIYGRSWKKAEPFPDFVPGLCRWTAEQGYLRLGVVRVGDAPVAAQIWFVYAGRALIFKLAYDDAFKKLSAGSVLTAELMRQVVDVDRVVEVDYLTGDDAYKADWMSHRRERVGLVAFSNRSIAGLAALTRHQLGRWRASRSASAAPPHAGAPEAAPASAEA